MVAAVAPQAQADRNSDYWAPENMAKRQCTSVHLGYLPTVSEHTAAYQEMVIEKSEAKSIVIDDSQYLLANELFDRANEKGYDKFTNMAANFRDLIHFVNELEDEDKIVYFLHHSELDSDGREKVKTIGKMLDEKLSVEGCFDVVIYCQDNKFFTQANGQSVAKTPEGMFELEIPNDLKFVDTTIREYYGMAENNTKEENN